MRAVVTAVAVMGAASAAQASGFEYPANGSVAMGRGGAFTARASDPTALIHNTAGILGLPDFQLTVSTNVAFLSNCFARSGGYEGLNQNVTIDTAGTVFANSGYSDQDPATPYPRVCNDGTPFFAPQVLATYRFNDHVAIGFGVYGPNSVGQNQYPDRVMTAAGLAPSPIRYMLLRENLLIIHPTIAVAVAPVHGLRFGLAIQPSLAHFEFDTMANDNPSTPQSPSGDILTSISATGFFMAGNFGVQIIPSAYFSFGAHVHANQFPTLSGTATATAGYYAANSSGRTVSNFNVDRLEAALPVQFQAGARFVLPRNGGVHMDDDHPARVYDPMRDDIFDLEADFWYESSSYFRALTLHNSGNISVGTTSVPAPPTLTIPHNWNDVVGVRVGGDVNIIPDVFALRLGVSYDTAAQSNQYAHIDIPAYETIGLHAGASVRVRWLTISAAFGQFLMSDLNADQGRLTTVTATGVLPAGLCATSPGLGQSPCQVNRGVYQASLTTLNLGLTARW